MARQLLPIAGAFIGGMFGQPQLGFVLGSIVGNAVDPQVVKVPGIKDIPVLSPSEGGHRQVAYGTTWISETCLIDFEREVRKVKHRERQGKSFGPVVESERLYRTFAIGLGEPVEALRVIRIDGKIVYDVRPGSTILEDSTAFDERYRFYTGAEDQLPDPDLEALPHNGVGNTPYHRGTAYLVFPDYDVTDMPGRVPTVEVEVVQVMSEPPASVGGGWIAGPVAQNGAAGGSEVFYQQADTLEDLPLATPTPAPHAFSKISKAQDGALFLYSNTAMSVSHDRGSTWTACTGLTPDTAFEVTWNGNFYYHKTRRSADGIAWEAVPNLPSGAQAVYGKEFFNNVIVAAQATGFHTSYDDAATWEAHLGYSSFDYFSVTPGHLQWKVTHNVYGYYTLDDFDSLVSEPFDSEGYRAYYSDAQQDAWMRKTFPRGIKYSDDGGDSWTLTLDVELGANDSNNVAWGDHTWTALRAGGGSPTRYYINVNVEGGVPGGWTEIATPLYGTGGNIVYAGAPLTPTVPPGTTTLGAVVEDVADRCGVAAADIDASALTDILDGVTLGGDYNGAASVGLFMPAYFFDLAQPDKQIVAVKRGAAVVETVADSQFVEEPDESLLRGQDIEYPRQLQLHYLNPAQNYAAPAATVSRTSPDVRVRGEAGVRLPIAMDETAALQLADKMLKVMWQDLGGEIVFALPAGPYAWLAPTDCLGLSLRGALYRVRVDRVEESAGVLKVTARRDRQSAYTSNLTAIPLPTPTPPPPALAGDTDFVVMNLPALSEAQDVVGVVIGMTGEPDTAWSGAQVEYRVEGGSDWTVAGSFTRRAVMGQLMATLPAASPHYPDRTNTLSVLLVDDTDELETLTETDWLREGNPAAIVYADGTAEIVQFQTATEADPGEWDLTTLQRGRLNTDTDAHTPGARFVLLDGTFFVPIAPALIGETLEFRVTSLGNIPETAPTATLVFDPVVAQTEFDAADLVLERATNTITAEVIPRHRFGSEMNPIASVNFTGYRFTATAGVNSTTVDTAPTDTDASFDVTGWSSPVTVTVALLNRYTGAGPTYSEAIA